jgi:Arm DNA-binding domain
MPKLSSTLLTKRVIDSCAPTDKRYDLWDSQVSGFGVRVGTSGVKTFLVRYRADGGGRSAPRRYVTVGRYGALTVEQTSRSGWSDRR